MKRKQIEKLQLKTMTPEILKALMNTHTFCTIAVPKELIERKDFSYMQSWIDCMNKCPEAKDGTFIIHTQGYDDEKRELFQIPEVVAYYREFLKKNPELFYYLEMEMSAWLYLIYCIDGVENIKAGEPVNLSIPIVQKLMLDILDGLKKVTHLTNADRCKFVDKFQSAFNV